MDRESPCRAGSRKTDCNVDPNVSVSGACRRSYEYDMHGWGTAGDSTNSDRRLANRCGSARD